MRYYALTTSQLSAGRSRDCDIYLQDDEASRKHSLFYRTDDQCWSVKDCGSTNGLYVNGNKVPDYALTGGEVVRIGSSLLRYFPDGLHHTSRFFTVAQSEIVAGPVFDEIRSLVRRAADSELTVLIIGETGTGKELVAAELHRAGQRAAGPWLPVNCSAIPATIFESELFGSVKGAYTGSVANKPGLIREASGGTLFLDEIGDIPLECQAKLLRVLQERQVRPVGATQSVAVDVRVVCATNRDLVDLVDTQEMRADLYARIAELVVHLPPLRDRIEDIPLLVEHFVTKHHTGAPIAVTVEGLEYLCCRQWPYNVRELETAVRRALLTAGGRKALEPGHFAAEQTAKTPGQESSAAVSSPTGASSSAGASEESPATLPRQQAEPPPEHPRAQRLREALQRHEGNVELAAKELGISRSQLYRRAKKYGVRPDLYRP